MSIETMRTFANNYGLSSRDDNGNYLTANALKSRIIIALRDHLANIYIGSDGEDREARFKAYLESTEYRMPTGDLYDNNRDVVDDAIDDFFVALSTAIVRHYFPAIINIVPDDMPSWVTSFSRYVSNEIYDMPEANNVDEYNLLHATGYSPTDEFLRLIGITMYRQGTRGQSR